MQRISVTSLEKYRRFMTEASPYDTEEALVESLKGEFKGNDKTKFGGAFHKLIEEPTTSITWINKQPGYLVEDVFFTKAQGDVALLYRNDHPLMVHEMNITQVYETKHFPIQVSGRVDSTEGIAIRDAKTKFRAPGDFKDYSESVQWKIYLDVLESEMFFYDLFEVKGFDSFKGKPPYLVDPEVRIIAHEPFPCLAYEDMRGDITTLLNEFIDYLQFRNYLHLLKPAILETDLC